MFYKSTSLSPTIRANLLPFVISSLVAAAPLFLVTIRGWASAVLFASALSALLYLATARPNAGTSHDEAVGIRWFVITLLLPLSAIFLSSWMRGRFEARLFDSPMRFLIAIPIFLFVVRRRVNIGNWLQYTLPCAVILTLVQQCVFHPYYWGEMRMATYFVDPLTFGQYSLTIGLMCLISINLFGKDTPALLLLKSVGVALGFYFSVQSGSRTGWLAAPIVIGFYILQRSEKIRMRNLVGALAAVLAILTVTYLSSTTVHERVAQALHEFIAYNWVGVAPDTSTGRRITFLRIGAELLMERPLAGFGDQGFATYLSDPRLAAFASPSARDFVLHAGFHNEVVTNAVRSGVWGLASTLALFIVPGVIFCRALRSASPQRAANALLGLAFLICQFVSGMSTEVFNLKFTASFSALLIAGLCGASLARYEQK